MTLTRAKEVNYAGRRRKTWTAGVLKQSEFYISEIAMRRGGRAEREGEKKMENLFSSNVSERRYRNLTGFPGKRERADEMRRVE